MRCRMMNMQLQSIGLTERLGILESFIKRLDVAGEAECLGRMCVGFMDHVLRKFSALRAEKKIRMSDLGSRQISRAILYEAMRLECNTPQVIENLLKLARSDAKFQQELLRLETRRYERCEHYGLLAAHITWLFAALFFAPVLVPLFFKWLIVIVPIHMEKNCTSYASHMLNCTLVQSFDTRHFFLFESWKFFAGLLCI